MKKHPFLLLVCLLALAVSAVQASPIPSRTAQAIAKQYLVQALGITSNPTLSLCRTLCDADGTPALYIYNIGDEGFMLVSAETLTDPVLGYSFGAVYDTVHQADGFRQMLSGYATAIGAMRQAVASGETVSPSPRTLAERAALAGADNGIYAANAAKDVDMLVETQWGQGDGYNEDCPAYSGSYDGHAVVGCVALAMAQVIRYHQYPAVGFGTNSYVHDVYGTLAVNYDSADYNYSLMPTTVSWGVGENEREAVSRLCYHCGVGVNMNYQSATNTDGSGAQTEDVVNALHHFGYFGAYYASRSSSAALQSTFDSLVLNDLRRGLPVICSGRNSEYGHAFVCDGYRSSTNRYHFNWGWDGWQDGYYAMDDMNGFSNAQGAVLNIRPSGLGAGFDTLYVDASGTGNGASWHAANPRLQDAIDLAYYYHKGPVLVKAGTYYGDTTADNAFTMRSGVALYGGFSGNESDVSQADGFSRPTILSGQGRRRALYCGNFAASTTIKGLTFADGYASEGAGVVVQNNAVISFCDVRNNVCTGSKGAGLYSTGGAIINNCKIHNNSGTNAVYIEQNDNLKNCLIANNNGNGLTTEGRSLILNCDVVSNAGTGIIPAATTTVRNCIIWNNDLSLGDSCLIAFCAVGYVAGSDAATDSLLLTNSNLLMDNETPVTANRETVFSNPNLTRGLNSTAISDWHLISGSPCIDAGDTNGSSLYRYDLDGNTRKYNGRVDMGCYENQTVGIAAALATLQAWPNPTSDRVLISAPQPTTVTLYNTLGQRLRSLPVNGSAQLSLGHLPQGLYLLRTSGGNTLKIIKR